MGLECTPLVFPEKACVPGDSEGGEKGGVPSRGPCQPLRAFTSPASDRGMT